MRQSTTTRNNATPTVLYRTLPRVARTNLPSEEEMQQMTLYDLQRCANECAHGGNFVAAAILMARRENRLQTLIRQHNAITELITDGSDRRDISMHVLKCCLFSDMAYTVITELCQAVSSRLPDECSELCAEFRRQAAGWLELVNFTNNLGMPGFAVHFSEQSQDLHDELMYWIDNKLSYYVTKRLDVDFDND